jgi:benzoyl-CoA reductase/2-hydroxyglutaryl-CoA dehydratase subunit BcrC/BadD/HgdB
VTPGSALPDLIDAYADRRSAADRWTRRGGVESGDHAIGSVIGYVGADVPVELITAVGGLPLRLAGDPAGGSAQGDLYLGRGVDPMTRSILSCLVAGDYGDLDRVLVSRDCEASLRLFYALRELRRVEPWVGVPEAYLVDILHLPHRTTARYDRTRIVQLMERLGDWQGRKISDESLGAAVAAHDEQRRLLAEVAALRRCTPARLTGGEFLAIVGAGTAMPVGEHVGMLRRLLAESDGLVGHEGTRVFLTGSGHDTPAVYEAIEGAGYIIVGEDHDWGDLLFEKRVGSPTLDALVERYQFNGPAAPRAAIRDRAGHTAMAAARCSAEVLISYVREADEAPLWDFEAQRRATGLPAVLLKRQRYGHVDIDGLKEPIPADPSGDFGGGI